MLTHGRLNAINQKQQLLTTNRLNSPVTKQIELKNSIKLALTSKIKVDNFEEETNKICNCGGSFVKGIYNSKDIIVCDKCIKVKYFKSKVNNKKKNLKRSTDNKSEILRSLKENSPFQKNKIISTKIYKKPKFEGENYKITSLNNPFIPINVKKSSFAQDNFSQKFEDNNMNKVNDKSKKNLLNSLPDFRTLLKNYYTHTIGNSLEREKSHFEEEKVKSNSNSISDDLNINSYKLIKLIGNGSYANIYLVQEYKTKKNYVFKKSIIDGERKLEKIKNQIKIIKALNELDDNSKENIIEVYKYCLKKLDLTSYSLYLLMPLAITDWSKQIQNKNVIFTEEKLFQILKSLSKALNIMQYKNIAHRDIKPQNILFMENGRYKLCDFDESIFVKKAYNYFEVKGTEMFMCPILHNCIFTGVKKIKINVYKSDIYSLGLCFVYAITKNLNILKNIKKCSDDKKNKKYIIDNIINDISYSDDFINVIMKMIAFNEKDRFDCIELYSFINKNVYS